MATSYSAIDRSKVIKVVFVGDASVGKSCMYRLFEDHEVDKKTKVTIGSATTYKSVVLPGKPSMTVQLEVWDTAGSERYRSFTRQYYRKADIVILTYDITQKETFISICDYWKGEVMKYSGNDNLKIILIGNKTDRRKQGNDHQVQHNDGQTYATRINAMFFEMSAHNPEHYDLLYNALLTLAQQVMDEGGPCKHRQKHASEQNIVLPNQADEQATAPSCMDTVKSKC